MNDPDFKGTLDEVSIWERPLTSREILQVYNSETPLVGTINGSSLYKITCTNTDTGQSVSIIGQVGKAWSCSDLGLDLKLKQRFIITIEGTAD